MRYEELRGFIFFCDPHFLHDGFLELSVPGGQGLARSETFILFRLYHLLRLSRVCGMLSGGVLPAQGLNLDALSSLSLRPRSGPGDWAAVAPPGRCVAPPGAPGAGRRATLV